MENIGLDSINDLFYCFMRRGNQLRHRTIEVTKIQGVAGDCQARPSACHSYKWWGIKDCILIRPIAAKKRMLCSDCAVSPPYMHVPDHGCLSRFGLPHHRYQYQQLTRMLIDVGIRSLQLAI